MTRDVGDVYVDQSRLSSLVSAKLRKNIQYGPAWTSQTNGAPCLDIAGSFFTQASVIIWYAGDSVLNAHNNLSRIN